jgi:hypothetical protein
MKTLDFVLLALGLAAWVLGAVCLGQRARINCPAFGERHEMPLPRAADQGEVFACARSNEARPFSYSGR